MGGFDGKDGPDEKGGPKIKDSPKIKDGPKRRRRERLLGRQRGCPNDAPRMCAPPVHMLNVGAVRDEWVRNSWRTGVVWVTFILLDYFLMVTRQVDALILPKKCRVDHEGRRGDGPLSGGRRFAGTSFRRDVAPGSWETVTPRTSPRCNVAPAGCYSCVWPFTMRQIWRSA